MNMDEYWSGVADRYDPGMHLRDVQAAEERRDLGRKKTWVLSMTGPYAQPISEGWASLGFVVKDIRIVDGYGRTRWITEKQNRVLEAVRYLLATENTSTTMRAIAASLGVCVATVSTFMRKLMAWGMLGYLSSRGRYGGITLFRRSKGDGLDHYARMARAAINAWWQRRTERFRAHSNVQSRSDRVSTGLSTQYSSSSANIRMRDDRIEAILTGMQHGMMRRVPCPAHGGEGRNLSFWRREDGSLGVKCWSHQCTTHEIKDAVEPWPVG